MDTLLPFIYSSNSWDAKNFYFSENGYITLKNLNGKCGIVSHLGKVLIPFEYDYITDLAFTNVRINKGDKYGLLKIPCKYDDIDINDGEYLNAFAKDSTGYDVYDSNYRLIGHYTFEPEFGTSNPKWYIVKKNGLAGIFDFIKNKYVIQPIYKKIDFNCDSICNTGKYLLYGGDSIIVLDNNAKPYQKYIGKDISTLYYHCSTLRLMDNKYQILKNMEILFPERYSSVSFAYKAGTESEQYLICKKDGLYGVISTLGTQKLPFEYDQIRGNNQTNNNYLFLAKKGDGYFCLDENMNIINNIPFDAEPFVSSSINTLPKGRAVVIQNKKYGIYDFKTYQFYIEPTLDHFYTVILDADNWRTSKNYNYFTINNTIKCFNTLQEPLFEIDGQHLNSANNNDVMILEKNSKFYLIKKTGAIISEGFDSLDYLGNSIKVLLVKNKGKYGCIDYQGKLIIPCKYKSYCNSPKIPLYYSYPFAFLNGKNVYFLNEAGVIDRTDKIDSPFYCQ